MIGEELKLPEVTEPPPAAAPVALQVSDLSYADERSVTRLDSVSFEVREGEILGIAGVDGNGQQELAELIVGLKQASTGKIAFAGADVTGVSPAQRIARGFAHVPEDRIRTGLVDLSIADNAALETIDRPPLSRHGLVSPTAIRDFATRLIGEYDVRTTGPEQRVMTLSGGNQQKVVLGRALSRLPRLIVAVQPTRGLDIGATAFVHQELLEQRRRGAAIVLVSAELDEVLALSDRILVMFAGRVAGELRRNEVNLHRLGALMTGHAA